MHEIRSVFFFTVCSHITKQKSKQKVSQINICISFPKKVLNVDGCQNETSLAVSHDLPPSGSAESVHYVREPVERARRLPTDADRAAGCQSGRSPCQSIIGLLQRLRQKQMTPHSPGVTLSSAFQIRTFYIKGIPNQECEVFP